MQQLQVDDHRERRLDQESPEDFGEQEAARERDSGCEGAVWP